MKQLDKLEESVKNTPSYTTVGKIIHARDNQIKATLPGCFIGELVEIRTDKGNYSTGVVKSFQSEEVTIQPLSKVQCLSPGSEVRGTRRKISFALAEQPFGKIFDAEGKPLDGSCTLPSKETAVENDTVCPMSRGRIFNQLQTGLKAIDTFCPIGLGQRMLIVSPPGCGKSTLLEQISRSANIDIVITALIGERGREVAEYYKKVKSINNNILISSTADESPLRKVTAGKAALAIAEHFSEKGENILILFDSLSRYLRALRDLGLSSGELPIRQGYPASVFEEIPKLIERAGARQRGSISAIFTMLSNDSIDEDPMINEVLGVVDGHIRLRKDLAEIGHFPAIDISDSYSRLERAFYSIDTLSSQGKIKKFFRDQITNPLDPKSNNQNCKFLIDFLKQEDAEFFQLEKVKFEFAKLLELNFA